MIKLIKVNGKYQWTKGTGNTEAMTTANARAFGVWWLRLERSQVDAGFKMLDETKHNMAFFSEERGDFLYVDTIERKS